MKRIETHIYENEDLEAFVRSQLGRAGYQVKDLKLEGKLIITAQVEKGQKRSKKEAANPNPGAPFSTPVEPASGETAPPARTTPRHKPD